MISNVLVYLQILPLIGKTCININSMGLQMGAIVETLAIIVLNITIFIDHLYKVIAIIIKQEPTVTESILLFNLLISHIYLIRLLVLEEKKE
jgi:riboflavin transporter FmnP